MVEWSEVRWASVRRTLPVISARSARLLARPGTRRSRNDVAARRTRAERLDFDAIVAPFRPKGKLSYEMRQAIVCHRLPPLCSAYVVEYWNTQCARRLSHLCGGSDR
jgi:hypothetical protein